MAIHPDAGALAIHRLGPADLVEVFGYLDRDPVLNVYLVALTLRDALARPNEELWAARRGDDLVALVYLGGPSGAVLPAGEDAEALERLAGETLRRRMLLPRRIQLVGTRAAVEPFVRRFDAAGVRPRLLRSQVYMALEAGRLPPFERLPELRAATAGDFGLLYDSGARLRLEELEEDPREGDDTAYRRRVEEESRDGSTFLWIAGVYTPAPLRNRGYARRALSELCARLFERTRAACLFVNDFNAPALAVYRRMGFAPTAEWASAFYDAGA